MSEYLPGSNGESVNIFLHPCCVINATFERDQSSGLCGEDEREECPAGSLAELITMDS